MDILNTTLKAGTLPIEKYRDGVKALKEQLGQAVGLDLKPLNDFFERTDNIEKLRGQGGLSPAQGDLLNLKNVNQFIQQQGASLTPLEEYQQKIGEIANMREQLEARDPKLYQRLIGSATQKFIQASGEGGPIRLASAALQGSQESANIIQQARGAELQQSPAAALKAAIDAQMKQAERDTVIFEQMLEALRANPGINLIAA